MAKDPKQPYPKILTENQNCEVQQHKGLDYAGLAQLVEQLTLNQWAQGSSP